VTHARNANEVFLTREPKRRKLTETFKSKQFDGTNNLIEDFISWMWYTYYILDWKKSNESSAKVGTHYTL